MVRMPGGGCSVSQNCGFALQLGAALGPPAVSMSHEAAQPARRAGGACCSSKAEEQKKRRQKGAACLGLGLGLGLGL
eukprot:scaffold40036_cov39-Phaeocystis_antarctica.AAC.4